MPFTHKFYSLGIKLKISASACELFVYVEALFYLYKFEKFQQIYIWEDAIKQQPRGDS